MELKVSEILDGKVKSITKFGAFIALADGKTGLVHISEVANSFVNDIREHLTEGQDVKVKLLSVDASGRINLSIKQTQSAPPHRHDSQRTGAPARRNQAPAPQPARSAEQSFEEKLKAFMTESDSKIAGLKQYSERRPRPRRR